MTCIAYRDGILAADRLVTETYQGRVGLSRKISRLGDGGVWGFAGRLSEHVLFEEWLVAGQPRDKRPEFENDHQAILIVRDAILVSSGKTPVFVPIEAPFFAIGSGEPFARGAMWHGATAEEAVRAAIEFDPGCGGPIDVIRCYEEASQFRPPETAVTSAPYGSLHPSHFGIKTL